MYSWSLADFSPWFPSQKQKRNVMFPVSLSLFPSLESLSSFIRNKHSATSSDEQRMRDGRTGKKCLLKERPWGMPFDSLSVIFFHVVTHRDDVRKGSQGLRENGEMTGLREKVGRFFHLPFRHFLSMCVSFTFSWVIVDVDYDFLFHKVSYDEREMRKRKLQKGRKLITSLFLSRQKGAKTNWLMFFSGRRSLCPSQERF